MPIFYQAMLPFVIPNSPSQVVATAISASEIDLSWNANNTGTFSYQIFRCSGVGCVPTSPPILTIGPSNAASFVQPFTGLTASTSYSFYVVAVDAKGLTSPPSLIATATTQAALAPTAPTNLTAATISASHINLAWTAATEAGGSLPHYNPILHNLTI